MTASIIISFCSLLLLAYVFDLTSSRTRIPTVILLLLLGWGVRQVTDLFSFEIPDLNPLLPILGTIGLILIVLEGSLELELGKDKLPMIRKSIFGAVLPLVALTVLIAFAFNYFFDASLKDSITNAIPFCIISSAIAIPSVRNLRKENREFIIYESSLSDIIGVLFFNFFAYNAVIHMEAVGYFAFEIILMIFISFIVTIGLSFLLSKIDHHIKFFPIILLIVLIYSLSKIYHLPGLIFILIFGLFANNIQLLKTNKWISKFNPEGLSKEVDKFTELTIEATFMVRSSFFLLFGFLIETKEVIDIHTLPWSVSIIVSIILMRIVQLKLSKLPNMPLLFVAPRGLITILLFLSIEPSSKIPMVNNSMVIQVVILSALLMMFGLMIHKKAPEEIEKSTAEQ
ncbi:MAG: sodium:proton antiporter [Flavobacteriales bacterium]